MSYQGYSPSLSPLTQAQTAAGDARFQRIDEINVPPGPFKNALINPSFDHWQRGTSLATGGMIADRWSCDTSLAAGTILQSRLALGLGELPESRFAASIAISGMATAGEFALFRQRIEGVRRFAGKRVAVTALVRMPAGGSVSLEVSQIFGSGGAPSPLVILTPPAKVACVANVWTPVRGIFDVPSIFGKTLGTDGLDYLQVGLWLSAGTAYDNRSNGLGHQNKTFHITDFEIREVVPGFGDQIPPFERVPLELDLLRCLIYYERITYSAYEVLIDANASVALQNLVLMPSLKAIKRNVPTAAGVGLVGSNVGTPVLYTTPDTLAVNWPMSAIGRSYVTAGATGGYFEINAEL